MDSTTKQQEKTSEPDRNYPLPGLEEDFWDALLPDDDQEPLPERGDFWVEQDKLCQPTLVF